LILSLAWFGEQYRLNGTGIAPHGFEPDKRPAVSSVPCGMNEQRSITAAAN